ncbi:MAG: CopG family transcriptional regulator [Candidatus Nanopelagicales bacterium]|nr:CopG family transcriptional regulator [Candidatus Nanopelagicales bacterium]
MKRTTVYLPDDLKARLTAEAARRQVTEAEIIRQAVDKETRQPRPSGGIFFGDTGGVTGVNVHEHMQGFGAD